jgi:leucyl-tRNA synthetase
LAKTNNAKETINYRLKDWLVSRQRYWGAPIPIINCPVCGEVVVPDEDLPVLLPYDVEFRPDGESPLKKSKEFMNCTCPKCGHDAQREADTLDTFVCSSWYFLRYPDAKNSEKIFEKELINKMLPVDVYVGGKEHAAMHLIYARFMAKAMRDMGYLNFDEPFAKLIHQGVILGPDGNKMSKSKGNTVAPDDYIDKYGSDTFRLYLMFGFSYIDGGPWKDEGIKAITKYLSRIEQLTDRIIAKSSNNLDENVLNEEEKELIYIKNRTIKSMGEDIDKFQFNTAIARSMEFLNEMIKYEQNSENKKLLMEMLETFIKLIAPLAPHFSEEMWEKIGKNNSVHKEKWPEYNRSELIMKQISIPVQVNGKVKVVVQVDKDATKEQIEEVVKQTPAIAELIKKSKIKKEIYIPNKIYSIVV